MVGDGPTEASVTVLDLRGLIEVDDTALESGFGGLRWRRRRRWGGFSDTVKNAAIADREPLSQWFDR